MKMKYLIALICVIPMMGMAQTPSVDIDEYYGELEGLSGKSLFDAICEVTNRGFDQMSYKELWTAYKYTDLYPADSIGKAGKIWDIYSDSNYPFGGKQCGTYKNEGDCYNREHSIPKSWFCECTSGMGADIMHLFPTDGKVNGMRSNYAYGIVKKASYTSYEGNKLGTAQMVSVDSTVLGKNVTIENVPSTVFEPLDCYKGDLARAYMGTMCKFLSSISRTSQNTSGASMQALPSTSTPLPQPSKSRLRTLLTPVPPSSSSMAASTSATIITSITSLGKSNNP